MYHNKGLERDTILANSHHHPNSSNLVSFRLSSSNSNTQEDTQAITIPTEEDHLHHHQLLDQVQDK